MQLSPEELSRLCQFFKLLLEMDMREKKKATLNRKLVVVLYLILDLRKRQR